MMKQSIDLVVHLCQLWYHVSPGGVWFPGSACRNVKPPSARRGRVLQQRRRTAGSGGTPFSCRRSSSHRPVDTHGTSFSAGYACPQIPCSTGRAPWAYALELNPRTMHFSFFTVPSLLVDCHLFYRAGETSDGELNLHRHLWRRTWWRGCPPSPRCLASQPENSPASTPAAQEGSFCRQPMGVTPCILIPGSWRVSGSTTSTSTVVIRFSCTIQ